MSDLIRRADAIEAVAKLCVDGYKAKVDGYFIPLTDALINTLSALPSADAVPWSVADKIGEDRERLEERVSELEERLEWIPCSKRLPEDSGDYLVCPSDGVIEDYSDCRDVMIMPYDADCEAFGWWTERYDPISLGFVDSDFDEFEVLAWMPLPKPYREDGE